MKKENSTNLSKYSGIAEQMVKMSSDCPEITKMILDIIYGDEGRERTELVQLIRQLRDYVILDRKDYEKLVQNSSPEKFNESALEARDASIKLLEQQLARQEDWVNYWKNKYEKCLEELKKETTRWWRF